MAKVQTKNVKNKQFMKPIIHNTKTSFITERKICPFKPKLATCLSLEFFNSSKSAAGLKL